MNCPPSCRRVSTLKECTKSLSQAGSSCRNIKRIMLKLHVGSRPHGEGRIPGRSRPAQPALLT